MCIRDSTTNVRQVGKEDCGCGVLTPRTFHDIDGLITNEPGVTLATFYADCVPLYFYDPTHKAIGLAHSGWRGTVGNIAKATVEAMQKAYHTDPADLIAAIGPSIDVYKRQGAVEICGDGDCFNLDPQTQRNQYLYRRTLQDHEDSGISDKEIYYQRLSAAL